MRIRENGGYTALANFREVGTAVLANLVARVRGAFTVFSKKNAAAAAMFCCHRPLRWLVTNTRENRNYAPSFLNKPAEFFRFNGELKEISRIRRLLPTPTERAFALASGDGTWIIDPAAQGPRLTPSLP
jgi:hypothetical protein